MAILEYYVDPSIVSDYGDGSIGDPYGDLQYALNSVTQGADGDRFNIKSDQAVGVTTTTDEILTATIDFSSYGTPSATIPLIFQGYTATANDGGIGGIDGDGSFSIWSSTSADAVSFVNLHLHNCGSSAIIRADAELSVVNCELNNSSGRAIDCRTDASIINNHIHDVGGADAIFVTSGIVMGNYLDGTETKEFTAGIEHIAQGSLIICFNVFNLINARAIEYNTAASIFNNSCFSTAGGGVAILPEGTFSGPAMIVNNIIEGFSNGGTAINQGSTDWFRIYGYNSFYNCSTIENLSGTIWLDLGNNETLDASPFTDAPNGDFSVNTSVQASAWPISVPGITQTQYLDRGAIQRQEIVAEPAGILGGGDASDYLEDQMNDYVFGAGYDFQTATVYLALYTSNPDEDNSGTEVSGNGYVRQLVSFGVSASGTISNDAVVTFPTASGSWGTVTHFAVFDSETSGNMLVYSDVYPTSIISTNDQITLGIGTVQIIVA